MSYSPTSEKGFLNKVGDFRILSWRITQDLKKNCTILILQLWVSKNPLGNLERILNSRISSSSQANLGLKDPPQKYMEFLFKQILQVNFHTYSIILVIVLPKNWLKTIAK